VKITVTITREIDDSFKEYAEDAIATDYRYIGYWGACDEDDAGNVIVYEHGGEPFSYPDPGETPSCPVHTLDSDWIARGIKVLAELEQPYYRLHELLDGEYDQSSLDCLVQAAALGEIRYG
jgi:hypothetical protein